MDKVSTRFWLEASIGITSVVLLLATLLWRDWIEIVFRVDPDHGDGSLEWMIVAVTAGLAITCAVLARAEWRRGTKNTQASIGAKV